jgi:hypothetical protein
MPSLKNILSRKEQKKAIPLRGSPPVQPAFKSSTDIPIEQRRVPSPLSDSQQTAQVLPPDLTNNRTEKYGLFQLHPTAALLDEVEDQDTNSVDIVAVHGINGDAYNTWTHSSNGISGSEISYRRTCQVREYFLMDIPQKCFLHVMPEALIHLLGLY